MPRKLKSSPKEWLELAFYDALGQWNRGELKVGDLLSPTPREQQESSGDRAPDIGWHHPSSISTRCLRRKQFSLIGMPKTNPVAPPVSMMGVIGTAIHRAAARLLEHHPMVTAVEAPVSDPTVPARGHMDMSVIDHDGIPAVVDWKGCMTLPTVPKEDHLEQVLWYQYLLGVPRGIIEYVNRGNATMRRFDIDWRDHSRLWEQSRDETVSVTDYTMNGALAPRTPESMTECRTRCQYKAICEATQTGDELWKEKGSAAAAVIEGIPV